jgi:meso-butanediol dehydrogenase / (S,S)-butanediol dehydrogenase / diacetyl reductase
MSQSTRLAEKVAIVVGGAHGIGRATALLFAREGASVVVADRDEAAANQTASEIRLAGQEALPLAVDVSDEDGVAALVEATLRQYGRVDVLVNSAGIALGGTIVATDASRWQRVIDVNLAGVYRTCRLVIPHMEQCGGGSIVNVASLQGLYGYPHWAAYAASKAGIIGLTRQVAVDYVDAGIRCNAVSPGAIDTELGENTRNLEPGFAPDPRPDPNSRPHTSSTTRLRSAGRPEDVAYAILFLACDEARHITGQNLIVDGGASACLV